MNHKEIAKKLSKSRYPTYPNGSTAKSQAFTMMRDLNIIFDALNDYDNLPPWVIMKLSEAKASTDSVANFISYYSQRGS